MVRTLVIYLVTLYVLYTTAVPATINKTEKIDTNTIEHILNDREWTILAGNQPQHLQYTISAHDLATNSIWIINHAKNLNSVYSYNLFTNILKHQIDQTTNFTIIEDSLYNLCTTNAVIINNTMYFTV